MKKLISAALMTLVMSVSAFAQLEIAWERTYTESGGEPYSINLDTMGNVYIGGLGEYSDGSRAITLAYDGEGGLLWDRLYDGLTWFSFGTLVSSVNRFGDYYFAACGRDGGRTDIRTVMYSAQGDSLWSRSYFGPVENSAYAAAIASDSAGNVYVAGSTDGPSWAILKYDRGGELLWTRLYTGHPNYFARGIYGMVLSRDGNIIVVGQTAGRIDPYRGGLTTIKFNGNGDELWAARYDSVSALDNARVVIDGEDNILISAISERDSLFRRPLVIKYLPNGDTAWARTYADAADPDGRTYPLAVDSENSIYISGYDYVINGIRTIKYGSDGEISWTQTRTGPDYYNCGSSYIAAGLRGAVYVAAYYNHSGNFSSELLKYSSDGELLWAAECPYGTDFALDGAENIYLATAPEGQIKTIKLVQTPTGVEAYPAPLPQAPAVLTAYPNPFNAHATIEYNLSTAGIIAVEVIDVTGKRVVTIFDGMKPAGNHKAVWDAGVFPSGVYFARLRTAESSESVRLILLK